MIFDIQDLIMYGKRNIFLDQVTMKLFTKYMGENAAEHYKSYGSERAKLPSLTPHPFNLPHVVPQTPDPVLVLKHKALECKYKSVIDLFSTFTKLLNDNYKQLVVTSNSLNKELEQLDRYLSHHCLSKTDIKCFSDDELPPYRITMDKLKSFLVSSLGFKLKTIIDHRPQVQQLDIVGSMMSIRIYEYDYVFFGSLFFNDETPLPSGYNHKIEVIDSSELVEYIQRYKPILSILNKSQF